MKDMLKIFKRSGFLLISILILFLLYFYIITYASGAAFDDSYQSVIQTKYKKLVETNNPKIIIVGGSSAAFGVDETRLKKETGYEVANLGLHAGFGPLFNTEISKANINKGDIVLLAYEYNWFNEDSFDQIGVDLVMSGIDDNIEIYKYIPINKWNQVLGFLNTYAELKFKAFTNTDDATGVYSSESFNENGEMIFPRKETPPETYGGTVDLNKFESISKQSIAYLKDYKELVESKGAQIYFIACPLLDKARISDDKSFYKLVEKVEEELKINYISDPIEYLFPAEYMYDTIYHCNNDGEVKRTELLISDLKKIGI